MNKKFTALKAIYLVLLLQGVVIIGYSQNQGIYFSKKKYDHKGLIPFSEAKHKLPSPVFEEDTAYVSCYWKAWELAFKNFYEPTEGSGFVSAFSDAAFNENAFSYDASFITMFLNYGHMYVPGIGTLDNFYARQHDNGEISREINRSTGADCHLWVNKERKPFYSVYGHEFGADPWTVNYSGRKPPEKPSYNTLDALNNPVLAWAELESYSLTGDSSRLRMVWEPLVHYYGALDEYLGQGNGLYITDWASMDNSTRNIHLKGGGCGVDISSQMALFARQLAKIASIINKKQAEDLFNAKAMSISKKINEMMWDSQSRFYYDLTANNELIKIKTVAGFWPLLAQVADSCHARFLAAEINNHATFNRTNRVPTLAASEEGYNPKGGYWKGAVWAPTTLMVIKGFETAGFPALAKEIALNHLTTVAEVYKQTGTIWENYAADTLSCGKFDDNSNVKDNFVGWSGMAPIRLFIEYAIGIRANALTNSILWDITSLKKVGVEQFWFTGNTISLIAEEPGKDGKRLVKVFAVKPLTLKVTYGSKSKVVKIQPDKTTNFKI